MDRLGEFMYLRIKLAPGGIDEEREFRSKRSKRSKRRKRRRLKAIQVKRSIIADIVL